MINDELDRLGMQLKMGLPPVHDLELKTDLWPRMLRRLEEAPARFGWFEAALSGLVTLAFVIYPRAILAMLYNL